MNFKVVLSLLVVICISYAGAADTSSQAPTSSVGTSTAPNTSASSAASIATMESSTATVHPTTANATTEHATTSHSPASTTPKQSDIWKVMNKNGSSYCILLKATITISFRYNSTKSHQFVTNTTTVPTAATAHGRCEEVDQWIELKFFNGWSLKMVFHKTNDSKYHQSKFELTWEVDNATFADAASFNGSYENLTPMFSTSKTGYLCTARTRVYDNSTVENDLCGVYMENMQLEAFQENKDGKFSGNYERCEADTISNLVPIIVGACLGGLIIIVLIAYLIGRKRSRRGYESV